MPIQSITKQPAIGSVNCAYRPIIVTAKLNTANYTTQIVPVAFCDVYIDDFFYKTISRTHYEKVETVAVVGKVATFSFDIQDCVQEYLQKKIGDHGGISIQVASRVCCRVKCKIRASEISTTTGLLNIEGNIPVQGSGNSDPSPGDGYVANLFYVVNSVLEHESNQNFEAHLDEFKSGVWGNATKRIFPLSHRRNDSIIGVSDNDYFPVFYAGIDDIARIQISYKNKNGSTNTLEVGSTFYTINYSSTNNKYGVTYSITDNGNGTETLTFNVATLPDGVSATTIGWRIGGIWFSSTGAPSGFSHTFVTGADVYRITFEINGGGPVVGYKIFVYLDASLNNQELVPAVLLIPCGTSNLKKIFPSLDFKSIYSYDVSIKNIAFQTLATSNTYIVSDCEQVDKVRIYFLNKLGCFDALNFQRASEELEVSSEKVKRQLPSDFKISDFSLVRNNIISNELKTFTTYVSESQMSWAKEIIDSPIHYQDFNNEYLSIVMKDTSIETLKTEGRYTYRITIQYYMSNENFTIRN